MNTQPIRVGIIGAAPDRGWSAAAHIPALKALPQYALVAVCTRRQESAEATARKFAIPHALSNAHALAERDDIDLVIVTARVPEHRALVQAVLEAGKHVFCEWPLALNTQEARTMLQAARSSGVRHMVGLQGRVHPVLLHAKQMIADGAIGRLLSVSLISSLASWGPRLPPAEEYRTDRANGATGLTIPGGHTLDTLQFCFGRFDQVSALLATQHKECEIIGTNRTVPVTSPDQVIVTALLANGAVLNAHIKADMATPIGVSLELNGTDGDLLLTSYTLPGQDPVGLQRAELTLQRSRRGTKEYDEIPVAIDDPSLRDVPRGAPFYSARLLTNLADAIRNDTDARPSFADAVACHELLDTVQRAADSGSRIRVAA